MLHPVTLLCRLGRIAPWRVDRFVRVLLVLVLCLSINRAIDRALFVFCLCLLYKIHRYIVRVMYRLHARKDAVYGV